MFKDQLTTEQIIARLKETASQNFDLDDTTGNDYVGNEGTPNTQDELEGKVRYGHGLLDLACASRPSSSGDRCRKTGTIVAATTDRVCEIKGQVLQGGSCVNSCTGGNLRGAGITGKMNTCVPASECLTNGLGATTSACAPASVTSCGGISGAIFNTSMVGRINSCIARTACTGSAEIRSDQCQAKVVRSDDCLMNMQGFVDGACVTGNAITPRSCSFTGYLYEDTGSTKRCVTLDFCTSLSGSNRYVDTNQANCVAACGDTQGILSNRHCTNVPTSAQDCARNMANGASRVLDGASGTSCVRETTCKGRGAGMNRYINSGMDTCVAMCGGAEGLANDECTSKPSSGAECQANGGKILTTTGVCASVCSNTTHGVGADFECTASPTTGTECQRNGGRRFRNGACTSRCNSGDGYNETEFVCVFGGTQTGEECHANNDRTVKSTAGGCVMDCTSGQGLGEDHECIAAASVTAGADCNRAMTGYVLSTSGGCAEMCADGEVEDSATHECSALTLMCEDGEGISADATPVCVSNGQTGADCNRAGMVLATSGSCAAACDGAEGFIAGMYTCTTMNLTGALCHANENRVYNVGTMACETVMTCTVRTGGSDYRFISNMQCVDDCPADEGVNASGECTSTALTGQFCINAGRVLSSGDCVAMCATAEGLRAGECVTSSLDGAACDANDGGVYNPGTLVCEEAMACTDRTSGRRFIDNMECIGDCPTGEGVDMDGMCTASSLTGERCNRNDRYLGVGGTCVGDCPPTQGINSSFECDASPTAGECAVNNSAFLRDSGCVAMCIATDGRSGTNTCVTSGQTGAQCQANGSRVLAMSGDCVAASACGMGEGVVDNECVSVATLTGNALTEACEAAGRQVMGTMCAQGEVGDAAIIEAFRGAGKTAEDSDLPVASGITDPRQREYANQPSLDTVGAAFAYGEAGKGADDLDAALAAGFGTGSNISVVTSKRFDPTHPEFSPKANSASFETLTRFYSDNDAVNVAGVISRVFNTNDGKARVRVYSDGFDRTNGQAYVTIRVQNLVINSNNVAFETISRSDFDAAGDTGTAIRAALKSFFDGILAGADVTSAMVVADTSGYYYPLKADESTFIELTGSSGSGSELFAHVGRFYASGNIRSYQIVMDTSSIVRSAANDGECIANNRCYATDIPEAANGAEMGILALINGLMNPDTTSLAYNTHGIAPGAKLDVFTTPAAGADGSNHEDAIYRARGIDVAQDSGADDDRNIVIINNNMASSSVTGAVTLADVNDQVGVSDDAYALIYRGLELGLADDAKQDAYIFAAADGRNNDVGMLAALPIVTGRGFSNRIKEYSIIVVAAEKDETPCGGLETVQDVCIAAPGKYMYRNRIDDVDNGTHTYATTLSTDGQSANAAASLVAGGLALLESIFGGDTSALIDRLLKTASQDYDLDDVTGNDWTKQKHGNGLMDLACAIKPMTVDPTMTNAQIRTAAGCADRHAPAGGSFAPPQQPQPDETPTGYAEGDPLPEEDFNDNTVDYCNIKGLRIILSGDLCSDDYILLADEEGNLLPETVGNLRFGMGFGDSLLKGLGITFFDAFDTAWTATNKYNPYAHILAFSNIVIAPTETRFDVEDRFYAMRYGTRPGQRKTWRSDTAAITMDFATQGMATKPYGVTRGQIRNTLTHDNMGADPYADVRFMLSAEDTIGVGLGRLKVMTYSGMAMGYALGLHSQGDAMMPSYLLTNRDSFHAPYLSLASSGLGGGMTYRFRDGGHIGFVMGEGTSLNADGTLPYQQQTERPRAFAGMMEYAPHKNLMFQMGALQEESTLLASQGSGLFDIQGGATAFVGVQAKQPISDNWQALFSGYGGRTQLAGSSGIVSGLDVLTTSFDVGLLGSHVLEQGDHLLLRAGQPMRVESGSLDLSYVSYRNSNRGVVSGTQSFDVAPSMRSVEFGVGYGVPIGERQGHIRFAVDYVLNPGHRRIRDEVFGIMSFRREF